jgi:polyhydroxybutyrate depolymerase
MGSLLVAVVLLASIALLAARAARGGPTAARGLGAGLLLGLCLLAQDGGHVAGQPAWPAARAPVAADTATPAPAWPNDGAVDVPVPSAGCGQAPPTAPGTSAQGSVAVAPATDEGATTRTYWVHVPPGYAASRPTPLVLVFHGGGGTALGTERSSGFSSLADQHGFLVVYPQGLAHDELGAGYTTWAATGPLDSVLNGVDDLLFVSNLLDALQRRYCVDPARIYATGFSAGGAMTAFLTCGLTGRIAAFAPMSGDAYQFKGGCPRPHPTSILEFHGAADTGEIYAGIPAREDPDWRRIGAPEWLTTWARRDGCAATPSAFLRTATVLGEQWPGCPAGLAVAHYLVAGLGHSMPPPIEGRGALDLMWSFFQAHPLRAG